MNLKFIDDHSRQLVLFDMDGVVAEYVAGEEPAILNETVGIYTNKRPLKSVISVAKELNEKENVTVGILSSCEYHSQAKEKIDWLKKFIPFISDANIHIVIWCDETYSKETRKYAKLNVIKEIKDYDKIFLIEDKHDIIKATNAQLPGTAHHISELIY